METKFDINPNFHCFLSEKGVHLSVTKKNGELEKITLTFLGWTNLFNQLASVKDYLTFGNMKITKWKNKSSTAKLEPLSSEARKIDDNTALFLSMYQHPEGPKKDEWAVFASLRAYFLKEAEIFPYKRPAIYLNLKDIEKLLSFNTKFYLLLKEEKLKHSHKPSESCEICSFVDYGLIIYHHLDLAEGDKKKVMKEIELCVNDFSHLNQSENIPHPKKKKKGESTANVGAPNATATSDSEPPLPPPPPPTPHLPPPSTTTPLLPARKKWH